MAELDVEKNEFDGDFTFTPTTGAQTVQPFIKNCQSIWLSYYEIRGVPVVAGIPVDHSYYLDIPELPMKDRVGIRQNPTRNMTPLRLDGIVSRNELEYPIQLTAEDRGRLTKLTFRLFAPDGTPAVFDQCTLQLTFSSLRQKYTPYDILAASPAARAALETYARNRTL